MGLEWATGCHEPANSAYLGSLADSINSERSPNAPPIEPTVEYRPTHDEVGLVQCDDEMVFSFGMTHQEASLVG